MIVSPEKERSSPGRRWWKALWFAAIALGVLAVVLGGGVLVQGRFRPTSAGPLAPLGAHILLAGALALCMGANGLLQGIGTGRRLLSPGSHGAVALTTLLALGGAVLVVGSYLLWDPAALRDTPRTFVVGGLGLYGAFGLMAYLHGVRGGAITGQVLGLSAPKVAGGLVWGVVATIPILAVAAANGLLLRGLGLGNPQADSFRWLEGRQLIEYLVAGFAVIVLGPVVEELFFRGYVFNAYLAEKGARTAYLGSALAFGVAHVLPTLVLGIFGMGLILAFIYRRSGTIVAPVVAHGLNNAIAFTALLVAGRGGG